jgi:hypothetical protein
MSLARSRRSVLLLALALGAVELALLALWQRNGYWEYSDGVYAETARLLLRGHGLYSDVAAAQPPPVYLFGALLLAIHDGLASLRAGLALAELLTAVLVALSVWRLCGRGAVAVLAGALAPLLPISLHEHAQLLPETLAAPLVMGGALWAARRERAFAAGVLLALAIACKLAFALPALAIALASVARRRVFAGLVLAGATLAVAAFLVFGTALWREAVRAQLEVGASSVHYVAGLLSQAAWNELPLLAGGAAALLLARHARDRALFRTLAAAAGGGLVLGLSVFKRGSYIDVLAVAEPPLLALAAAGATWAWERARLRWMVPVLAALLVAQSASLLIDPGDPGIARRPFSGYGLQYALSPAAVDRAVAAARRCPPGLAYGGAPFIAFLADRRMPGDQPDVFIVGAAPVNAPFARRAAADPAPCPG